MANRKRPSFVTSLVRASHPRESLLVAVGVAAGAAASGRALREIGLVLLTALVGRLTVGWLDDVSDRRRDQLAGRDHKPVAQGWLETGTVTFTVACATLLLIPLSISNGTLAGVAHLLSVLAAWGSATRLKTTRLSFLPWAVSFALLPAFLSYGGWGGGEHGGAPTILMTVLAALLGVGLHVLFSLRDLADDHRIGLRTFPLLLGLKVGATKLLVITVVYLVAVGAGIVAAGLGSGLVQQPLA